MRLPQTIDALSAAQSIEEAPEVTGLRRADTEHARKLASYRATLDAGAGPTAVSGRITGTQAARLVAGTRLRVLTAGQQDQRMSTEEIPGTLNAITCLMRFLEQATPCRQG